MTRSRFLPGFLIGFLAAVLLIAAVFVFLATRPVPLPAPPPSSIARDVTLTLSESYLGALATTLAQQKETVIQRITVDLQPGALAEVVVEGQLKLIGIQISPRARLTGVLQMTDSSLFFLLQKVDVAGIGIPRTLLPGPIQSTIEALETAMNDKVKQMLEKSGLAPASLTTDQMSVTIGFLGK